MKKSVIRLPFMAAALSLVLIAVSSPFAQTPVERHGRLRVEDGRIVGEHGDPVQLRGMSLYWSIADAGWNFYNANVVNHLAASVEADSGWNISVIRAAMGVERNFNSSTQRGYIGLPDANKERVITVVNAAIAAGIYVIIDWHSYIAEINTPAAIAFFEEMAERYGDVPNVLFEIYNEPNGSGGHTATNNGGVEIPSNRNPFTSWSTIKDNYMQPVTNAIRAKGTDNIILIGTPNWCQYVDTAVNNPVSGTNLVYTAHFYANQNDANHRQNLRSKMYYAMKSKKQAVFVSEFGLTNANGHGALATTEADKWFAFLDENKIGYAAWAMSAHAEWSACSGCTQSTASIEYAQRALGSDPGIRGRNWNGYITENGLRLRDQLRAAPTTDQLYNYLTVNIIGQGSVTSTAGSGTAATDLAYRGFVFDKGATGAAATAYLRATPLPNSDWIFAGWEGDVVGTDPISGAIVVDGNKTVTARFSSPTSLALPVRAGAKTGGWSVRNVNGVISLRGSASSAPAKVSLYDIRGRLVRQAVYGGKEPVTVGKLPAGNYMMVVKNISSGKEVYRTRVSFVN